MAPFGRCLGVTLVSNGTRTGAGVTEADLTGFSSTLVLVANACVMALTSVSMGGGGSTPPTFLIGFGVPRKAWTSSATWKMSGLSS